MQVILREDIPKLGNSGDIINVSDGYGRNYLVPRGLAVAASAKNVKQLDHQKRVISQRDAKLLRTNQALKAKVEGLSINVAKQVGSDDKLFGSVTTKDIAEAMKERGIEIDRKKIHLAEPIRSLGVHTVSIEFGGGVNAALKVWVVASES